MSIRTRLALVALGLAVAAPLGAQTTPLRDGFFIGFGFGGAGGEVSGNTDASGGTGYLILGGTLSQKVRLAGEFQGFSPKDDDQSTYGTSTVSVLYYPSARGNFFLKGGIGAAEVSLKVPGPDGTGIGLGTAFGAGYDFRIGRKFSITPQLTFFGGGTGDIKDDDNNVIGNDVNFGVVSFSVGVVFH